jgi:hypothetical protein
MLYSLSIVEYESRVRYRVRLYYCSIEWIKIFSRKITLLLGLLYPFNSPSTYALYFIIEFLFQPATREQEQLRAWPIRHIPTDLRVETA